MKGSCVRTSVGVAISLTVFTGFFDIKESGANQPPTMRCAIFPTAKHIERHFEREYGELSIGILLANSEAGSVITIFINPTNNTWTITSNNRLENGTIRSCIMASGDTSVVHVNLGKFGTVMKPQS